MGINHIFCSMQYYGSIINHNIEILKTMMEKLIKSIENGYVI